MTLIQVLKAVENSSGPILPSDLSRELGIELAVLEGMLEFWIRKGRIQRETQGYQTCTQSTCPAGCRLCSIKTSIRP